MKRTDTKSKRHVILILVFIWLETITGSRIQRLENSSCSLQNVDELTSTLGKELLYDPYKGIRCDIKGSNGLKFDFDKYYKK